MRGRVLDAAAATAPTGRLTRRRVLAVVLTLAVAAAAFALGACTCSRKPEQSLVLGKTIKVGGFPVRLERIDVDKGTAVLAWSAPKALKKSPTKRRNFEFATGAGSSLVAADGLRFPMQGSSTFDYSKKDTVSGKVPFDANGLDLKKLARIEIDGARWVDSSPAHVVAAQGSRLRFRIGPALFEVTDVAAAAGKVQITVNARTGYREVVGTIIDSALQEDGKEVLRPASSSATGDLQTFVFPTAGKGPWRFFIKAVRIEDSGPFVLKLRKAAAPAKKKAKKG